MRAPLQAKVGGYWLHQIGAYSDLTIIDRWPGGNFEVSWTLELPVGYTHPALRRGASVQVLDGGLVVWSGLLSQPDRSTWECVATGLSREAESGSSNIAYMALDGSGNSTSIPDVAIDAAIARGLPWVRRDSFSATAYTDNADNSEPLRSLGDLLDLVATEAGKRWAVWADGAVVLAADPTTPTWHLTPGAADLGYADDEYASTILGRYLRKSDLTYQTVIITDADAEAARGHREFSVDLTSLGPITTAKATGIANGILAKGKSRLGWTNGIEAGAWDITTPGGVSADLTLINAGDMIRLHGIWDERLSVPYLDVVIGERRYTVGEQTVQLTPVDYQARTLASVVEDVVAKAAKR